MYSIKNAGNIAALFLEVVGNLNGVELRGHPKVGEEKTYFKQRYQSVDPEVESYILFVERSVELLKERGLLTFLIPHNFATNYRYQEFRNFLFENMAIQKIIMLKDNVFPEVAVETSILMGYKDYRSGRGPPSELFLFLRRHG